MHNEEFMGRVAIACGGTGGHLFPGLAVAEELRRRDCAVTLLISPKEVDQQAARTATGVDVAVLPAVGLSRGGALAFVRGFAQSVRSARRRFANDRPEAVLAMGGFTSAPPVVAGRLAGVPAFLHESNTIPGRANRWLSRLVQQAFVGFPEAGERLYTTRVKVTGTPVRPQFTPGEVAARRSAMGLDPARPVLVVTGGSQGASGLNDLVIEALPLLIKRVPGLQLLHLTGPKDEAKVRAACECFGVRAEVRAFCDQMHLALGAASAVVSRAGASSLAELAAMRVPAVLVPYPAATDNHQYYNALALVKTGAARMVEQAGAEPEFLAETIVELIENAGTRGLMQTALARWHMPQAAGLIAESIVSAIRQRKLSRQPAETGHSGTNLEHHQSLIV